MMDAAERDRPGLPPLRRRMLGVGGAVLHVVEAGPSQGDPVLLLHGFPEFWFGWRRQLGALARSGYHVIAPDLRGYNLSSKPPGIAPYRVDLLVRDVLGLMSVLALDRVVLAGHDWGGYVAWWVALLAPDRLRRLIILNAPHPAAADQVVRRHWRQWFRSWYVLFFQLPKLPAWTLALGNFTPLAQQMKRDAGPAAFAEAAWSRYRRAWGRPGAMAAMLNWYRALLRFPPRAEGAGRVDVPTDILWGREDRYLLPDLAAASADRCRQAHLLVVPGVSHWIQYERADLVGRVLAGLRVDELEREARGDERVQ